MLFHRMFLLVCFSLIPCFGFEAIAADLLAPSNDAPRYQLSNIRTEGDRLGRQVIAFDFKRTRQGKGSVSVSGKSSRGALSISASVPSSQDSGTIRLSSFFGRDGLGDIELYFVQSHRLSVGNTLKSMVSNAVRLGNPGAATQTRPWTGEEKAAAAEFVRIMNDDSAHKPPKNYVVTVAAAEGWEFVPNTAKLVKGTKLNACYQDKWYPVTTISENDDGSVNVRWDDWGAQFDVSMIRGELTIEKNLLSALGKHPASRYRETVPNWASASAETTPPAAKDAKRRKHYPVSIEVPADSEFVPKDLKIKAGTKLQACYAQKWNPITALAENDDGTLEVRWDDYGSGFDCSMVRDELIIKRATAHRLRTNPSAPEPTVIAPVEEPKRRKKYTVSIAVPSDSQFVPKDAKLAEGTRLQACWAGKWNPITMLSHATDGTLNVRWDDFGPSYDCSMVREELIIKKAALKELMSSSSETGSSETGTAVVRTWTDATGQFKIKAKLIKQSATQVTLLTEKGKEVTLPLSRLSEGDQEFLQSIGKAVNPFE